LSALPWGAWLEAFALTQLVEVPVYVWLLRADGLGAGWRRWLWGFGASAWTHPAVWFVFPPVVFGLRAWVIDGPGDDAVGYGWMLGVAEAFAVLGEMAYWRVVSAGRLAWRDALRWALLANGASVLVGVLTRWLVDWP
jgi:hypothetical protein